MTNKRFFLTKQEQKDYKDQPLSLCPNCKEEDATYGYLTYCRGYRKHIIFDLLKDKADLFYSKMQERRVVELTKSTLNQNKLNEDKKERMSQDSENYYSTYTSCEIFQENQKKNSNNEASEEEASKSEFYNIKWKTYASKAGNSGGLDEEFDYLSESIRNS